MASKKISDLTATTTPASADVTVLAQSGFSKKITMTNLINGLLQLITTSAKGITSINDSNDNEVVKFTGTASAVNEITITNNASGSNPTITASGNDSNIDISITAKGTGKVKIGSGGIKYPNTDGSASSIMMTDGSGVLSLVKANNNGQTIYAANTTSGTKTIAHGLGRTPTLITFYCTNRAAYSAGAGGSDQISTFGTWTNSSETCNGTSINNSGATTVASIVTSTTKIGAYYNANGTSQSTIQYIDVTGVDATNITISLPATVSDDASLYIDWFVM